VVQTQNIASLASLPGFENMRLGESGFSIAISNVRIYYLTFVPVKADAKSNSVYAELKSRLQNIYEWHQRLTQ